MVVFLFLLCLFKVNSKNSSNQTTISAYDSINSCILLSRWEYHSSLNSCCQLLDSGSLARSRIPKLRNQRSFGLDPSILYELSLEPFGTCGVKQPTISYAGSEAHVNFRHQGLQPIRQHGGVHWLDGWSCGECEFGNSNQVASNKMQLGS